MKKKKMKNKMEKNYFVHNVVSHFYSYTHKTIIHKVTFTA